MNARIQAKYGANAKIIKALANPTRLLIVDELSRGGERCVCELTAMAGLEMSTVSRHLTVLKNVGLLEDHKRGAQVYYRIRCGCVPDFFDCVESVMKCNGRKQRSLPST